MLGQLDKSPQLEIFREPLRHKISEDHDLIRLAKKTDWEALTRALSVHYSPDKGRRSIPVRKIAGLLILKKVFAETDEGILARWLKSPVIQFFCGEIYQQDELPFNRSELVKFRRRIGPKGMAVIFSDEMMISIGEINTEASDLKNSPVSNWSFLRFLRSIISVKGKNS